MPSPISSRSISPPRRRLAPEQEILAAIVELADDGFAATRDLVPRFRRLGERDLRRSLKRVVRQALVLERPAPDGRRYVALSSEGWERLRENSR